MGNLEFAEGSRQKQHWSRGPVSIVTSCGVHAGCALPAVCAGESGPPSQFGERGTDCGPFHAAGVAGELVRDGLVAYQRSTVTKENPFMYGA